MAPVLVACLFALASLAGCRQNMHDQAKAKTYRESDFFADGVEARPLPAHTVARDALFSENAVFKTGLSEEGELAEVPPMPVTRELLTRGQERFNAFCSPCHGRLGDGHGAIVQRGFKQPVSFHDERLRNSPIGYFVNNMTEGFGQMPSYAAQIPPADRWAIAAYVRVLQYAENAQVADLDPAEKQKLEQAWKALEAAKEPQHGEPGESEGEGEGSAH
ncbi:MAG TPA: cytochrome c [Thermoanaerobaculia bacterium]|jgi:mono/diheme cytochrome c family protein|nr:cytochrome c [Thermoanaerobaculia bacterium]